MRYSSYFYTLLVVLLVFTAFGGFYIKQTENPIYNVTVSDTFKGAYTNTTELAGFVEDTTNVGINMTDQAKSAKLLEDDYQGSAEAQVKTIKLIWSSYDIVKNLVINIGNLLHLPPIISGLLLAGLIFAMLFGFLSLIFRWKT